MNWQPIETAPRDMTPILAVCAGICSWAGKPFVPAVVVIDKDGNVTADPPEDYDVLWWHLSEWKLTHWMPLPEAPK